tara:strand:+ start:284 stop:565 length:282 start_codon:yes stop_codon:yes gene_type:complete
MKRKLGEASKLAKAALINGPKWNPSKGFKYIKDVRVGELVDTGSGLRAIVADHGECSTTVLVLRADCHPEKDRQFYLGKHRWAQTTEVKIIGD